MDFRYLPKFSWVTVTDVSMYISMKVTRILNTPPPHQTKGNRWLFYFGSRLLVHHIFEKELTFSTNFNDIIFRALTHQGNITLVFPVSIINFLKTSILHDNKSFFLRVTIFLSIVVKSNLQGGCGEKETIKFLGNWILGFTEITIVSFFLNIDTAALKGIQR